MGMTWKQIKFRGEAVARVAARQGCLVLLALNHAFGVGKHIVAAGMIGVEVSAHQIANVGGAQADGRQSIEHEVVLGDDPAARVVGISRLTRHVAPPAGVDQDIRAVSGLDQVARQGVPFSRMAYCRKYSRMCEW